MATAIHRSTPVSSLNQNVNSSQAQVSAPVLEFRCMFTHDCHKKSKKWHDGSLRFHTFNRRVMVYDDSKNLVGDLHYRQNEEFGEGLELRLDRPVLVQVEEPLGQTNTDLTPLLGRQRQDGNNQSSHPTQPTRATLSRINAANSQLKPKSIKELLGASQGRLGRARLPVQSPFEQRQALSDVQPISEPSPKRRKIDTGKENEPIIVPAQPVPARSILVASRPVPPAPVQPIAPILNISSDDEPGTVPTPRPSKIITAAGKDRSLDKPKPLPPAKPAKQKERTRNVVDNEVLPDTVKPAKKQKQRQKQKKPSRDVDIEAGSGESPPRRRKDTPVGDGASGRSGAATPVSAPLSRSRSLSAASLQSQRRFSSGPKSSLKFGSQRPRPKLMYRALLTATPKEHPNTSHMSSNQTPAHDVRSVDAVPPEVLPTRQRQTDLLDVDSFFAASQIAQEIPADSPRPKDGLPPDTKRAEDVVVVPDDNDQARPPEQATEDDTFNSPMDDGEVDRAPDSPLFMPRTTSQISPLRSQRSVVENHDLSGLSQDTLRYNSPFPISPVQRPVGEQRRPSLLPVPEAAEPPVEEPSSPAFVAAVSRPLLRTSVKDNNTSKPTHLISSNIVPLVPPAVLAAQPRVVSKVKGRLFRRVVSEQTPPKLPALDHFSDDEDLDFALRHLDQLSTKQSPTRAQKVDPPQAPPPLQRATSDPVNLDSMVTMHDLISSSPTIDMDDDPQLQKAPVQAISVTDQQPAPPQIADTEADAGPWSTTEAFLLFDWWPPSKQKPDYGQGSRNGERGVGTVEDSASTAMKAVSNKKYGMFGSARLVSQR